MIQKKLHEIRKRLPGQPSHAQTSPIGMTPVYDIDMAWKLDRMSPTMEIPTAPPGRLPLRSEMCTEYHFYLDMFRYWCSKIKETPRFHRKQWEFVYIMQALWERGMLVDGMRGVGFGVGKEPLVSFFANEGCEVLATDLDIDEATQLGWTNTNQRAHSLEVLNERDLCDPDLFTQRVKFRDVDMNAIPEDLEGYDFCWSACCLEHLGSIDLGGQFILNSLKTLKVGGWAIHTTELNLTSNEHTLDHGSTVIFRKRDLAKIVSMAHDQGHYVEPLILHNGYVVDNFVDTPPFGDEPHLRLQLGKYASTSVGLIIRRGR